VARGTNEVPERQMKVVDEPVSQILRARHSFQQLAPNQYIRSRSVSNVRADTFHCTFFAQFEAKDSGANRTVRTRDRVAALLRVAATILARNNAVTYGGVICVLDGGAR
jgi:hypothetical protein